jgi:hypothetical protein
MFNACLTFSWLNNIPFDHEAERLFGPSGLPATHCTGAVAAGYGGAMIRPKSSRAAPGYMWFLASLRLYLNGGLGDQYLTLAGE